MTGNRIPRLAAPFTCLLVSIALTSCSGSDESNIDVLAEWRKNAPTTSSPTASDESLTQMLPTLPEGADPFAQENYRIAAIRSYVSAREYVLDLMELAGEFDLGSETWASGMRDLAAKFNEEAAYFARLNPPAEYVEKQRSLMRSMELISGHIEALDAALVSGNFTDGSEALAAMQEETNTLVQNGRFDEGSGFASTTVPTP